MKRIVFALLLSSPLLSPLAFASDCTTGAETQGEVIECEYSTNFAPLEHQIKKEYESLLADIENSTIAAGKTHEAMVAAQKSWLTYRENTCEFALLKEGGGTVAWGIKYSCMMEFSKARLKTLQRYRKELAGQAE
ncbi:MAG TPA: lysozyme inhibitor LprI family protein [Cellvibrio sp.]|nr:lysozyme inhibitor LprI family protein [Cellvibrio sp.]